jgi:carbonic anhydrase
MHNHEACGAGDCTSLLSRRRLLLGGITLAAGMSAAAAHSAVLERPASRLTAAGAWQSLQEGNARYATNQPRHRDFSANRMALVQGQQPIAAVLGCADSRVSPELLFDQSPGDMFVARVAGNFTSIEGLASLEYAIEYLGTPLVVVLGHTQCGAVGAAIKVLTEDIDLPGHLQDLVQPLFRSVQHARRANAPDLLEAAIESNVRHQAARITSMSPVIGRYVASGEVQVVGGVYEIATGRVRIVT